METAEPYDLMFKITIIGNSGVGKSSILLRFTDDDFEEGQPCTIGVDFKTKNIKLDERVISLSIWDTAGQEKFRSLTSSYYRGTHGIILVYDVTKRSTFTDIKHWLDEVDNYATNPEVIKLLIANKIDMPDREVSKDDGLKFAKKMSMLYIECSAKTKVGIQQAFEELVQKILDTPSLWQDKRKDNKTNNVVSMNTPQDQEEQGGCLSC